MIEAKWMLTPPLPRAGSVPCLPVYREHDFVHAVEYSFTREDEGLELSEEQNSSYWIGG